MSEDRLKAINRLGVILNWVYKVNRILAILFFIAFGLSLPTLEWNEGTAMGIYFTVTFTSLTFLSWGLLKTLP